MVKRLALLGAIAAAQHASMTALLQAGLVMLRDTPSDPVPQHTSVRTGKIYVAELMATRSEPAFRDTARMSKATFKLLKAFMVEHAGLRDSRKVSANEKLLMLIHVLKGNSNRATKALFQHSGSTVSTALRILLDQFMSVQEHFFREPLATDPVSTRIGRDRKYFSYFRNCIGAEDGSHISASVPPRLQDVFRNRKGLLSQNVYVMCDFRLLFTNVHAGWEGSAHDMRVKNDAVAKGAAMHNGKYRLGDAGISLSPHCLTPYRGVRYHLKETARAGLRPRNFKELFNLRHASLRNAVERILGVLKKRFNILTKMPSFSIEKQVKIVMVCCMLHNFIRSTETYEDLYWKEADHDIENAAELNEARDGGDGYDDSDGDSEAEEMDLQNANKRKLNKWRDDKGRQMWADYVHYLANR